MIFVDLKEMLESYTLRGITLPKSARFGIDDFENVVPEDFHQLGWCEYNTPDGHQSVIIYNSEKFNIG